MNAQTPNSEGFLTLEKTKMLTAERLRELINYDPLTGIFIWKKDAKRTNRIGQVAGGFHYGYWVITVDGKRCGAHRLAWLYMTGEWPKTLIDHKDTNKSNNKWDNLREATYAQNRVNSAVRKINKTGIKGITKTKYGYQARISLGTYKTKEEAADVFRKAALIFQKEFVHNSVKGDKNYE